MDNLIEFAKEQCEIFPEDSEMGKYLMKTLKMLQAEQCEDAVSREDVIKAIDHHTFETDDGLCLDEDISIILEGLPYVKPVAKVNFSKEDMQEIVDKKVEEMVIRKKGKWINKSHTSGCGIKFVASECTCCGKKTFFDCDQLVYNYCPNCGAEMESEEE